MSLKQKASPSSEVNEKMAALITNANAVRAIAAAVEGTLGPKGLDTMLVDQFGDVVITNDGVTILTKMEATHPAAKMLINIAKSQQEEIGDGTTTATIMAGALVNVGVNQVAKGVPVTWVIQGIKAGIEKACSIIESYKQPIEDLNDERLHQVALVAGREHKDIADLVIEAAKLIGEKKLKDKAFKLSDVILSKENAENQVFMGVIINKDRMNKQMPKYKKDVKVMIIDDALEPEEIEEEALGTESGFAKYLELQNEFRSNIEKIIELGVGLLLVDRGVDDVAEEMLTDAGVIVIQRVSNKELEKAKEHSGAKMIKRTGLKKDKSVLEEYIGYVEEVVSEEKLEQVWIKGGKSKPMATVVVGAATEEVVDERERIAKDAAAAVQSAVKCGVVPGGGALELAVAREMEKVKENTRSMAAFGIDCVIEALKRPLSQIVTNAGFNPLEKLNDVIAAQSKTGKISLGIDCDTGEVADMLELGILDPVLVKVHALKAAGEIAVAILRIDTIIKMKDEKEEEAGAAND